MALHHMTDGAGDGPVLILAHGSGAPMDTPFMTHFAEALAGHGVRTQRFEFEFMARRRTTGKKAPPARAERLLDEYRSAVAQLAGPVTFIGGKSLGGRMASMIADELFAARAISGVVCLGYPFHPPGKPEKLRTAHLARLACPMLVVQGERDPFGTAGELAGYQLSSTIETVWMPDGDHSFKPRKKSGQTLEQNIEQAASATAHFMTQHGLR